MRSDSVKTGTAQAPHRSLFNALGFTEEERRRPMIGIVSCFSEIVPGHMNLDKITEAVKMGVAMAGGMPVVFPAIAVCDGIAMGHVGMKYSLVTRDLIADSTECMAMAHGFDGLVCIPNCDKNVPGLLMAAARVNIPTIFVSGGPMLAGHVHGQKRSLSSMFEAVGSVAAGTMTMDELAEFEEKVCPTCGSCSGMYTANSMNCLTEAIGMGLRGNGTIPAVYSERIRLAKHAGMKIMELVEKNIRPRDIMTPEAFQNALSDALGDACNMELVQSIHDRLRDQIEQHKESHDPEPLELSVSDAAEILRDNGVEEEKILAFCDSCTTQFGDGASLNPANLIDSSRFEVKTADATISVDPEHSYLVEARIIDGRKYLLIPADEDIEVNGFGVRVKGE